MSKFENELVSLYAYLTLWQQEQEEKLRQYDWQKMSRPDQRLPLGDWRTWLILAGRGFGKTRTGAEAIRQLVDDGSIKHIGIIGATDADARAVMVEGESGLLSCYPEDQRPVYESSKRMITWTNGAKARLYSADCPRQLRGPQFDFVWLDELCKFEKADELWQQVNFCLRLGERPRALVTTTPKSIDLIKALVEDKTGAVYLTKGSTFDNAKNLSSSFLESIKNRYDNTTLGRQELYGELVNLGGDGLWSHDLLSKVTLDRSHIPELRETIIAVDPAVTSGVTSDETGIIVMGKCKDGYGYVLDDLSGRLSPNDWMLRVSNAYKNYKVSYVILESNQGGDVLKTLLQSSDPTLRIRMVRANVNKYIRAEPVHALYEQGRVKHVYSGILKTLEDQMRSFSYDMVMKKNISPDRVDALVWGISELMLKENTKTPHGVS